MSVWTVLGISMLLAALIWAAAPSLMARKQRPQMVLRPRSALDADSRTLYTTLVGALPQYQILPHVSLARFLTPSAGSDSGAYAQQQELLRRHAAPFLICDERFAVFAIVELEDVVRGDPDLELRAQLYAQAGLPMLHWDTVRMPAVEDVREAIAELEALHEVARCEGADDEIEPDPALWEFSSALEPHAGNRRRSA